MEGEYDYLFKIVLIGDAGVGKTSIVRRYTDGVFSSAGIPTIGVDFCIKTIKIGQDSVKLQIWDTAGQERFRTITQSYYRSADAIVLVFDVSSIATFNNLSDWLSEVERYAGNNVHRVLIGNKCDLSEREVTKDVADKFAQQHGMPFLETSAKNSENIDELFQTLAKTLRDNLSERRLKGPNPSLKNERTVNLQPKPEKEGGSGCCG
jgi:small GTP-binding protein